MPPYRSRYVALAPFSFDPRVTSTREEMPSLGFEGHS